MTNTKISALTDGVALAATDRVPVARSPFGTGDNAYITGTEISDFVSGTLTPNREVLTDISNYPTSRDYYVRTDGSDSNDGLSNTSSGAFLTIQHACNVVATLDLGYTFDMQLIIHVADGTYGEVFLPQLVGGFFGDYNNYCIAEIHGNASTPSSVIVNGGFSCNGGNGWLLANMKITGSIALFITEAGILRGYNLEIDTNKGILLYDGSSFYGIFDLTFTNTFDTAIEIKHGSFFLMHSAGAIKTSGSGSYGTAFLTMTECSRYENVGTQSNSGGITGPRFICDSGSVVSTASGLLTDFPGSVAGTIKGGAVVNGYQGETLRTVGALVSASTAGAGVKSFVTDANATTFGSIVATGGSNGVPVYSDGTNWRIG